jgi:hypothetical protein
MAALQDRVKTGDVVLMCLWQQPSLRVVADRPLPAPLLDAYSEAMPVMLEEQLGARADWDRLFFRYALVKNQSGSRRNIDMPPGSSVWLVESQCPPEARRNLAAWLKPSRQPRPVWSSPTTDEVIGIDLSRVQVQAPVSLPVRVPPELEWPQRRQP